MNSSTEPDIPAGGVRQDSGDKQEAERRIDSDSSLSGAVEQQGGAALGNVGKSRPVDRMFKPDVF